MMDFSAVCRTCLGSDALNPIFTEDVNHSQRTTAIFSATGIKVQIDDGLPQQMCKECAHHMYKSLLFRVRCKESETKLKHYQSQPNIQDQMLTEEIVHDNGELVEENMNDVIVYLVESKCEYEFGDQVTVKCENDSDTENDMPNREKESKEDQEGKSESAEMQMSESEESQNRQNKVQSSSGGSERKTSKAWQYFTILKDLDQKAKCNFCGKVISYKGGGPYNLIRHTKSQHPTVFTPANDTSLSCTSTPFIEFDSSCMRATTSSFASSSSPTASQPMPALSATRPHANTVNRLSKISDYLPKRLTALKAETINKTLVKLFAKHYLPFCLVDSPEFREFVDELNPNYELPSRKTLSNVLVECYYSITKEKVKAELALADRIALTTDRWSSDPNDNYIGVTAHFINQEADLRSYTLECAQYSDRHTAQDLARQLASICDNWEIREKIVAVTTDNANNIKAAVRLNNWKQVSCFAHSLNLVVENAIPEIKPIHQKVKRIVELFKRSQLACERLTRMQVKLGESVLKVKQDDATRWGSTCDMFERVLLIRNSLLATLANDYSEVPTLTSNDLVVLQKSTEILSFFKEVTEELSSERSVTISEVIFITNALKNKCLEFLGDVDNSLPPSVRSLAHDLHDELEDRFSALESDSVLLESTLLDPRFKKHGFHHESACERALSHLNETAGLECPEAAPPTIEPPPAKKVKGLWCSFDAKIIEMAKNTSPTSDVQREVEKYLEEPPLPRTQNPLKWWLSKKYLYPRLYAVASQRLCISATSVPPEQIFTKAGQMIRERRNRLTGKKISQLCFLNKNL